MRKLTWLGMGLLVAGLGCDGGEPAGGEVEVSTAALHSPDIAPTGKGVGTMNKFQNPSGQAGGGKPTSNGISYHNGPVMLGTVNVYYIWYGNWATNTATTILTDFASSIGGSAYYNINT